MSTGHKLKIKGLKLGKSGRHLVSDESRFDVATQLKRKAGGAKKVRYGKGRGRR